MRLKTIHATITNNHPNRVRVPTLTDIAHENGFTFREVGRDDHSIGIQITGPSKGSNALARQVCKYSGVTIREISPASLE